MNIKKLEKKLLQLDQEITTTLNERKDLNYDCNDSNDCLLYKQFGYILGHFEYIHAVINYLQRPVLKEGIIKVENGKYTLDGIALNLGNVIEILKFEQDIKGNYWYPIILGECEEVKGKRARVRLI